MRNLSQCSRCERFFRPDLSESVFYCSAFCEREHDLFKDFKKEVVEMAEPVKISYLSEEELKSYREKTKHSRSTRKPQTARDWRWPQNRRKDELRSN